MFRKPTIQKVYRDILVSILQRLFIRESSWKVEGFLDAIAALETSREEVLYSCAVLLKRNGIESSEYRALLVTGGTLKKGWRLKVMRHFWRRLAIVLLICWQTVERLV